jgi:hypothetical protein
MIMNKFKFIGLTLALALVFSACEQEIPELRDPEPTPVEPACPPTASKGSADFTKYVAIGTSITSGYMSGALFTEGQNNSLAKILATQFACVGGGQFNQPDINSVNGFFTGGTNPVGNTVLGRLLLQGTPPIPTPTISDAAAVPSPINQAFMYSGDKANLNNFAVPGIQIGQIFITETGDWTKFDLDPNTPGPQPHPAFNPYYARFASNPGASTILGDAMAALANGGTFFSFWLGDNDILAYAVTGASNPAIFTSEADFEARFLGAVNTLLSVPNVKGVVGNIPNVTLTPFFRLVPYNAIPLPEANAAALNAGFAGYNGILDVLKGGPFNLPAAEMDSRKVSFVAGQNRIVIIDDDARDLGPYYDMIKDAGQITDEQRAALEPYRKIRQTTNTDLVTLTAATVLGTAVDNNPSLIRGLTVPLTDQFILTPQEQNEILQRTVKFNEIIAAKVNNSDNRLALADVNAKFNQLAAAGFEIVNNVLFTPSLAPPAGGFSEDGVHPNARGNAYIANVFIDAINQKFGASIPKANIGAYKATGLPVNP